jgi:hypothetical protein
VVQGPHGRLQAATLDHFHRRRGHAAHRHREILHRTLREKLSVPAWRTPTPS